MSLENALAFTLARKAVSLMTRMIPAERRTAASRQRTTASAGPHWGFLPAGWTDLRRGGAIHEKELLRARAMRRGTMGPRLARQGELRLALPLAATYGFARVTACEPRRPCGLDPPCSGLRLTARATIDYAFTGRGPAGSKGIPQTINEHSSA